MATIQDITAVTSQASSSSSLPPPSPARSISSYSTKKNAMNNSAVVDDENDDDTSNNSESHQQLITPLMEEPPSIRSRKKTKPPIKRTSKGPLAAAKNVLRFWKCRSCNNSCKPNREQVCQSITVAMNVLARVTFWCSLIALVLCVIWYSYELKNNGTEHHLIAWFSAGAFVLLGFPISMYGIIGHLANYNQPNVQCYIVRILWMVPIYSMESWLCLRFHSYAIYIETLRDCYEAYVLYNFLQFLIQVLGGEEELILLLKDKSPTRGSHMWGLQWCVKPWLMGLPLKQQNNKVHWTSPFFVKCKFGVLQYVLLKVVSSVLVMILELHGLYKEGDFTPKGGYLYICLVTNTSQCWALYCLIFFYYATKNELGPIRPVGKFLSVKALVFFTWWQSVGISMLYQAGMIPDYAGGGNAAWSSEAVAKGLQDYLICIEMFVGAIVHTFVFPHSDYKEKAVAARLAANRHSPIKKRRMGRKRHERDDCSKTSAAGDVEMGSIDNDYDSQPSTATESKSFISALLDSTIPTDVMDHTVGIVKGEYHIEKKTLLHHAATSDQYDLFSGSRTSKKI